jgi:hypothetical protein
LRPCSGGRDIIISVDRKHREPDNSPGLLIDLIRLKL